MLNNEYFFLIFHEIKNSITLINSSLQLVAKKHPEVNNYDYWAETMSEIDVLKNMTTQLSLFRLSGQLNFKKINVQNFVQEIANTAHMLSQSDLRCLLTMEDNIPAVDLDPQLMKHALTNLLKNAYEAMEADGIVRIEVFTKKDYLIINISDSGKGLDPALGNTVFKPFITTKDGGSGLGLSITKQIVESHHGTITFDSQIGKGCTFSISLPFTQS